MSFMFLVRNTITGGVPRIWEGGGPRIFLEILKFACREAMRFARGVRGHAPPRKFLKMVQFCAFWRTFGSDFLL